MKNISDIIERFLLDTLGEEDTVFISRNELAAFFSCAPSQINYVLSTRFTPERGYAVESRRGGGGGVTVIKMPQKPGDFFEGILETDLESGVTERQARQIIERLDTENIINRREASLIAAAVADKSLLAPMVVKDRLRGSILKNMLITLVRNGGESDENKKERPEAEDYDV